MQSSHPIQRIVPIDALRGLVMILMALDHVRDFFHIQAMTSQANDLSQASPELFFTRWITHFCAPAFMLTAGAAAFFKLNRTQNKSQLSRYLWTRGLWLILLELIVLRFAMFFSLISGSVMLTVLYGLGGSMILLGFLIHIPFRALCFFTFFTIILNSLFTLLPAAALGPLAWVWNLIYQPGLFMAGSVPVFVAYPVLPWAAIMTAGFCLGSIYSLASEKRMKILLRLGTGCLIAFLMIRGINLFGDPAPWTTAFAGKTFLSFLNTTKYPPSLSFILMTAGPIFFFLSWLDQKKLSRTHPLLIFGQTPLFYFLAHFFFIHLLLIPFAWFTYGEISFLWNPLPSMGGSPQTYPAGFGYSLGVVYLVWLLVVIALYPLCRWYSALKKNHPRSLLRYL